ncbi:beta-ketoacyl synthase N-terminal-like domain-containing protein [Pseudozobellia sp. WGM2]|uniref:beta-ketoacyl synthase N-terminal-like domain-containing protein n=1 Tax=Pseudozobellia sp. WGM2 TaxID=2787625 RepID=UPI001ADF14B2
MTEPISITGLSSISPLGISTDKIWEAYQNREHQFSQKEFSGSFEWVASISEEDYKKIENLRESDPKYKNLDKTVLFALFAARNAVRQAAWRAEDNFGINIGSSRGATELFEKYHEDFLKNQRSSTLSSPTTTLGNISSWLAHDLQTQGPEISHSITCSTGLHAVLNGVAWLKSGMADKFLVGGSEAPLTPFTISQMKALKVYSRRGLKNQEQLSVDNYPCLALDLEKSENTMILGEGASVACLETGVRNNALAHITGVGYATEPLKHNISITTDAICFQRSMQMALGTTKPNEVDVVVMHAPGTIKGDLSEYRAIKKVFGDDKLMLTTNKWKVGHTFATSGMLSLELAVLMLRHQKFIDSPFERIKEVKSDIKKVMVNAVGFGGNAVSVLLERCSTE